MITSCQAKKWKWLKEVGSPCGTSQRTIDAIIVRNDDQFRICRRQYASLLYVIQSNSHHKGSSAVIVLFLASLKKRHIVVKIP